MEELSIASQLSIGDIPVEEPDTHTIFAPFGEPVTPLEVSKRLGQNLYTQLADGSDENVRNAVTRASIYMGTVMRIFRQPFNMDNQVIREVVLIYTIYEMHMALGHEEAGREYRFKARDIIRAQWGDFPDSNSPPEKGTAAAVAKPPPRKGFKDAWR
ncbi:MAG: hypothetical protein LBH16_09260 [Treponema sp.]|jgi:hypothetical protein|nr:hypothetical protein [Treponema sp.]